MTVNKGNKTIRRNCYGRTTAIAAILLAAELFAPTAAYADESPDPMVFSESEASRGDGGTDFGNSKTLNESGYRSANKSSSRKKSEKVSGIPSSKESKRIKYLTYSDSEVYAINTRHGYQTNVLFDPQEEIQTISVGDRSLWQIIPSGNRLFIRPLSDGIATNMTILTNKHTYEFDLKSVSGDDKNNVYAVRFTYPDELPSHQESSALPDVKYVYPARVEPVESPSENTFSDTQTLKLPDSGRGLNTEVPSPALSYYKSPQAIGLSPIKNNFSYTYAGSDNVAPLQVYDNGRKTFVKYKNLENPPPIAFKIDNNGNEAPLSSATDGSFLVVDGVAGEIALRSKGGEVRVYNELINPR